MANTDVKIDLAQSDDIVLSGIAFPKNAVISRKDFTIGEKLGEGAFGAVHQGQLNVGSFGR